MDDYSKNRFRTQWELLHGFSERGMSIPRLTMWLPLKSGDSRPPLADSRIPSSAKTGLIARGIEGFDEYELTPHIKPGTQGGLYVDFLKQGMNSVAEEDMAIATIVIVIAT